jgi:hypothetical protein
MTIRFFGTIVLGTLIFVAVAPAQSPAGKGSSTTTNRQSLFVGNNGKASWLPKTSLLPSAEDLEVTAQKLSSRLRNLDPFGLSTFPREEDIQAKPEITNTLRPTPKPTLNQALQTLKITGICLERREFLIGGRNVFEGDVMQLAFQNEVFLAQVVEVGTTQIRFRDMERQESGVLAHSLLPQLSIEPIANRSQMNGLEDKLSPMETQKPKRKP